MYKILVIEDDQKLQKHIKDFLQRYDYEVQLVDDFMNIDKMILKFEADLILLDINLPYYDGFHLCRLIRKESNVPIIIISARSGDVEQVMGIELGADDYITKPFNIEILLAKIKSALRRAYGEYNQTQNHLFSFHGLLLDQENFKLKYKNNEMELTKNEFKLLKMLIENKDKIVKREALLNELWDDSHFVDDNTLTVNVTRVKHKFEELGIKDIIKTKRGIGYFFDSTIFGDNQDE